VKEEYDILSAFDIIESGTPATITEDCEDSEIVTVSNQEWENLDDIIILEENHEVNSLDNIAPPETKSQGAIGHVISWSIFLTKYCATSLCIFGVLMVAANYSAYFNLAYSIIYAGEMEMTQNSIIESVAAASIKNDTSKQEKEVNTFKDLNQTEEVKKKYTTSIHSMGNLTKEISSEDLRLPIEITPYENRIIIPKIGKNIPLVDIKQKKVNGVKELNNIFMDELENGVIRYPGSAKPGENGNSFIFGHSSNFPWMKWDYNDVFALLDHVTYDDEVVVYYGQEKHTYKIRTKNVIAPGDVSVLESDETDDKSKLTLMTCWPIGTTLNRLVLTGDLISVE